MIDVPQGSKELLIVDVEDRLGTLTDLDTPTYSVRLRDQALWNYQDAAAAHTGLRAECLIDTDGWDKGTYELFLKFLNPPEAPILGPFEFEVV